MAFTEKKVPNSARKKAKTTPAQQLPKSHRRCAHSPVDCIARRSLEAVALHAVLAFHIPMIGSIAARCFSKRQTD